jgi:zinc D-Ala-D-Ala carboxypeptidase
MTQLSKNFSLSEMTVTSTGIPNVPAGQLLKNLTYTAQQMELVRAALGNKPIQVNSAYRSDAVNRAVGGVTTSAHSFGFAVDFVCPSFGTPYEVCAQLIKAGIKFDQLIHEKRRWVHIGFGLRSGISNRQQVLTLPPQGGRYMSGLIK